MLSQAIAASVSGVRSCVEAGLSCTLGAMASGGAWASIRGFMNHPAGPKTIHFWAPTFKWAISLANIADLQRPPEKISLPQQLAITATGVIWSRYSMVIIPRNYNLLAVNIFMAFTGSYQLFRKLTAEESRQEAPALPAPAPAQ